MVPHTLGHFHGVNVCNYSSSLDGLGVVVSEVFTCSLHFERCVCVYVSTPVLKGLRSTNAGGTGPSWIPVPTKLFHDGGCGD